MMIKKIIWITAISVSLLVGLPGKLAAQDQEEKISVTVTTVQNTVIPDFEPEVKEKPIIIKNNSASGYITVDFKDADIHNVLRAIAYKSGINIVAGPEVEGKVTVRLANVPWQKALDVILAIHDLALEYVTDEIITVTTMEKLKQRREEQQGITQTEPLQVEVINLKYKDANDVKRVLQSKQATGEIAIPRVTVSVLEEWGHKGWPFGEVGAKQREWKKKWLTKTDKENYEMKSKVLIITGPRSSIEMVKKVIKEIDVLPQQVLIEARIVEVNHDDLKDLGLEMGTGEDGWSPILSETGDQLTAQSNPLAVTPGGFHPESAGITGLWNPATGFSGGLTLVYQKILGTNYRVILHALEENVDANTLSAPRIMTLNNQEATIMIGEKFPILKGEVEEGVLTTSLDYYQDIGIKLNVVPQICENNQINMIIHPAVTSYTATVSGRSGGEEISKYPIIITREAETQLMINDGETIVIGGLLKDVTSSSVIGVPFLSKIPILGLLFQRRTTDIKKIDLLIFITGHVIKSGDMIQETKTKTSEAFPLP